MGSAPCKSPKSSEQDKKKDDSKKITIGVFGLDNAGKTSTVKAIEGAPTKNAVPTTGSNKSIVPYPTTSKGDNKSQERVTIIDLSGSKTYRERSWSEYYDQIHGLIFVIDASENDRRRIIENQTILEDLLGNRDLKDKPILILANKQDRRGAIKEEDDIKEKLQIEKLKRKHKIEFCTAIPRDTNKPDNSIREGFAWLIRTIESNYDELNSRVNNSKNSRQTRPIDRKPEAKPRQKNYKSDQSDNDDGIVYGTNRKASPPPYNRNNTDYRSTINSTKLPNLDLNKTKTKTSGHETYDEDDDDIRSRPNISRSIYDNNDHNQSNLTSTSGFNKKKKVIGATGNDVSIKKSNSNEPKSFRSSYEPFPEEAPWSSSTIKTTKPDDNISKFYTKPLLTNDSTKRTMSPLVHDTKPYNSSSITKRSNRSDDDDDDFNQKQKLKSIPLSTNKPSSTFKKPTSGIYGADFDEDDLKPSSINRRSNLITPPSTTITTIKKPYKHDDDDDDDDYLKKTTSKTTKSFDSDDENKNKNNINKSFQRPSDRLNLTSEYRGITSKPPPSPSLAASRSKFDKDDFPSSSSSKPLNRSQFNKDDYSSTLSKIPPYSKYNDDDDRPVSSSKINTHSKYGDDDYKSTSKPTVHKKYDDDDDFPSSMSKYGTRSKQDNDYSSKSKPTTFPKYEDDDQLSPLSKPLARTKYGDDNRPSSPYRSTTRPKHDDDDDYGSSSKTQTRSSYKDSNRSSSPFKQTSGSKFDDDDDDYKPSSKPTSRSKFNNDDDDYKPSSKPTSRSKFDDDDDDYKPSSKPTSRSKFDNDDDDYKPSSKPISRSKFNNDDDDYKPSSKPTSRSKFDDDDDDYKPSSKPTSRSKYDDDDDDSPLKPTSRAKYDDDDRSYPVKSSSRSKFDDDDDDYSSVSKKNNYSSRDDDYGGSGGARSRVAKDEFDLSKGGLNSGRAVSASTNRFRSNLKSDT